MSRPSVIVIGAGIAGLTAAWHLARQGCAVRVLEAQDYVGGRMGQRHSGPIVYNTGARLIYPFGRVLHSLIKEVGLQPALLPLRGLSAQCRLPDGSPYRIDLMPSARTLGHEALDWHGRWGLLRSAAALLRLRARNVDPDVATSIVQMNPRMDAMTLAQYIRETAGEQVLQRLVEPVFRGTRSQNPEDISPTFYLSTTPHLLGRETVYTLQGGMQVLPERLAQGLDVQCGVRVTQVEQGTPCSVHTAEGQCLHADVVVCATEGARAGALLANPQPEQQRMLAAVRYNSLGIVHVALQGDVPPLLEFAPRQSASRIATWQQTPARAGSPAGLYCQLTPEAVQEAIATQRTEQLRELLWPEIQARLPDVEKRVIHTVNQWIAHKLPVFYPGYGMRVWEFLQWQQTGRQQVYFCGDWLSQPLLNGACRSGNDVAALVRKHWG